MRHGVEREAQGQRPHVILMTTHDTGAALGCYGSPVATPHLDRLAAQGASFTEYYCTAAQCTPSRSSIMTGRFPHENGLMGLAHMGWRYHEGERCLAHELADAGYETLLFGLQHEHQGDDAPARLGYQTVGSTERQAVQVAQDFAAWLRARAAAEAGGPFFAAVGCFETHLNWGSGGPVPVEDVTVPPYLPDTPVIREELARFYGSVLQVDAAMGLITEALDATGLDRSTLVIFTVDHGIALPRAKGMSYDPGLETALIMRLPGVLPAGQRHDALLSNVDLLPTVLEAAGVTRHGKRPLAGRSFWPLACGHEYERRDAIFFEMTWHDRYNPIRGMRTAEYKCMLNFDTDGPNCFIPADIYRSPSGKRVRREWTRPGRPPVELYDLAADPWEQANLAGMPEHHDMQEEMVGRIRRWMAASGDPLQAGHVVPPRPQAERLRREEAAGELTGPITPAERGLMKQALQTNDEARNRKEPRS